MKTMAVRVGVLNNFNCTQTEYKALDQFAKAMPWAEFFVNSNAATKNLENAKNHPYKVVVTANPMIVPDRHLAQRLLALGKNLAFARLKWVPGNIEIAQLLDWLAHCRIPTVITAMRFNSGATLAMFADRKDYAKITNDGRKGMGWFKIAGKAKTDMLRKADALAAKGAEVSICDRLGMGCPACGNCTRLTLGHPAPVEQLNLSASGFCKNHCPDCFARSAVNRHGGKILFDKVYANTKMRGHIHDERSG